MVSGASDELLIPLQRNAAIACIAGWRLHTGPLLGLNVGLGVCVACHLLSWHLDMGGLLESRLCLSSRHMRR